MGRKRIPVSQFVLWFLEKSVGAAELTIGSMADLQKELRYGVYDLYPRKTSESTLAQAIRRLRERGLIEFDRHKTGEIILRLTQAGSELIFLKKEVVDWDGRWRIVIFDIPESKRAVRDVLRWKLKQWDFVQWQKSVWATKKLLTENLRKLIKELEVEDWVLVIESDNVGREPETTKTSRS